MLPFVIFTKASYSQRVDVSRYLTYNNLDIATRENESIQTENDTIHIDSDLHKSFR